MDKGLKKAKSILGWLLVGLMGAFICFVILVLIALHLGIGDTQAKTGPSSSAVVQTAPQPAQIEVTNNVKEYEGVIVEGPIYLANTMTAVVGVEIEVDGYKVVKPALISNFTSEEMTALKKLKIKIKIRSFDIRKEGESPFPVWVVQK